MKEFKIEMNEDFLKPTNVPRNEIPMQRPREDVQQTIRLISLVQRS